MESCGGEDLHFLMFREVLSVAMLYFFLCSNWRDNAKKGIMWPWAMKGNKSTMCCCCSSSCSCFSYVSAIVAPKEDIVLCLTHCLCWERILDFRVMYKKDVSIYFSRIKSSIGVEKSN